MPIQLVANYVNYSVILTGGLDRSRHLQLVFNDQEMEVQGPGLAGAFVVGDWDYERFGETHSDPENTNH